MKGPEVSIRVTDLTLRFPVYGVDAKSLKKHLARITVGGKLGRTGMGATEVTALSNINLELRLTRAPSTCTARSPPCST